MATTSKDQPDHWQPEQVKIIGDQAIRFRDVCVHEIRMGDVEDPELYAAQPIWEWQQSEHGKWVMEHATETPSFNIAPSIETYGWKCAIYGKLNEADEIIYRLKYT